MKNIFLDEQGQYFNKDEMKEIGKEVIVKEGFSEEIVRQIAEQLSLNLQEINFNEFFMGMNVELEHGTRFPEYNVTNDCPIKTAKIALAHLKELPDYYTRLKIMEEEGKAALANKDAED
jgi:hypothetical protein